MAIDEVLIDVGLNTDPAQAKADELRESIKRLGESLNEMGARNSADFADGLKVSDERLKGMRDTVASMADLQFKLGVVEGEINLKTEKQKEARQKQVELLQFNNAVMEENTKAEELKLRLIKAQNAALDEQNKKKPPEGFGGGLLGKLSGAIPAILTGGAAGVGAAVGTAAIEGVHKLYEAFKDASHEANELLNMQSEFNRVTQQNGIDGPKMLREMQRETEGLVSRLDLVKTSVLALQSPLQITAEQLQRDLKAVVTVADVYSSVDQGIQAYQAVMRNPRRVQSLAGVMGMTTDELTKHNIPEYYDSARKAAEQYEYALAKIEARAISIGKVPTSLEDVISMLTKATRDMFATFSEGAMASPAMQGMFQVIAQFAQKMIDLQEPLHNMGERFASLLAPIGMMVLAIGDLVVGVIKMYDAFYKIPLVAGTFKTIMGGLAVLFIEIGWSLQVVLGAMTRIFQIMQDPFSAKNWKKSWDDWMADIDKASDEAVARIHSLVDEKVPEAQKGRHGGAGGGETSETERNAQLAAAQKLRQTLFKEKLGWYDDQIALETKLIADAKALNESRYRQGEIDEATYQNNLTDIRKASYEHDISILNRKMLEQSGTLDLARKAMEEDTKQSGAVKAKLRLDFDAQQRILDANYAREKQVLVDKYNAEDFAQTATWREQLLALERKHSEELLKITADFYAERQKQADADLAARRISAAENIRISIDTLTKQAEAQRKAARDIAATQPKGSDWQATLDAQLADIDRKLGSGIAQIIRESIPKISKALQDELDALLQMRQGELAYSKGLGDIGGTATALENILNTLRAQRIEYQRIYEEAVLVNDVKKQQEMYQTILKTADAQRQFREELYKTNSLVPVMGQAFQQVGEAIQGAFGGAFEQGIGRILQLAGRQLLASRDLGLKIKGGQTEDPTITAFKAQADKMFTSIQNSTQNLNKGLTGLTDPIAVFREGLLQMAEAAGINVDALRAQTSATAEGTNAQADFTVSTTKLDTATKDATKSSENFVQVAMRRIGDAFDNLGSVVLKGVGVAFDFLAHDVLGTIGNAFGWLGDTVLKGVGVAFDTIVGGISTAFGWLGDTVLKGVGVAFDTVVKTVGDVFGWLGNTVLKGVGDAFATLATTTVGSLVTAFNWLKDGANGLVTGLGASFDWLKGSIGSVVSGLVSSFDWLRGSVGTVVGGFVDAFNWFKGGIGNVIDGVADAFKWLGTTVLGGIGDAFAWLGRSVFDGIGAAFNWLTHDAVAGVGNAMKWLVTESIPALGRAFNWLMQAFSGEDPTVATGGTGHYDENGEWIPGSSTSTSTTKKQSDASKALTTAVSSMVAGFQAVTGFVQAIMGAKTGAQGALAGGLGGASLGNSVSAAMDLSGVAGAMGPIIGAVAGMAIGLIMGRKKAKIQEQIDGFTDSYKKITDAFAENSNNLNGTVVALKDLMQQVQVAQSNSKKGHDEFQKLIDQYSEKIKQLELQQRDIINDLNKQVMMLTANDGARQYLATLDQIMEQYNKFRGAARDANELAKANEYLARSLADYQSGLQDAVMEGNQQAIEDSLSLNDLLLQRVDLQKQYNDVANQKFDPSGSVTREVASAQEQARLFEENKKSQLQQIADSQRNLDNQIAAAQHRVDAEKQIYDLADTRIGLEQQLLVLQNIQTDKEMARLQATAELLNMYNGGQVVYGDLSQILPVNPNAAFDMLNWLVQTAYNNRAAIGSGAYRGSQLVY